MNNPIMPKDGYKTGGWYEGRQAWQDPQGNWTFSEPGQINKFSNQPGAGQAVNPEVIRQSNIDQGLTPGTNEAYLAKQREILANGGGISTTQPSDNPIVNEYTKQLNDTQAEIDKLENERIEQKALVSENPFLAESSLVGRLAKIDKKTDAKLAVLETKKKTLQSQITASQPELQLIESTDNAGNVTVTSVDKKTGKVIGTQNLGNVGKGKTTTDVGGDNTVSKTVVANFLNDAKVAGWSKETNSQGEEVQISPFMKLVINYAPKMSLDQIYQYYRQSELFKNWGEPVEDKTMISALYASARGY